MQTEMDADGNCWQNITDEFKSAISQLNLGELIKNDQFTLLEAMGAIELMDQKMDIFIAFNKSKRTILTLEQSIRCGKVRVNNLEPEELIGIIDDTYACLVTWLEGHMLSQTVMTNMYLHDTKRIEDRCLRVFCQAILKIVDLIDKLVITVYCVEEEDFQLNGGKFNLDTGLNEQKILSQLEDLCQHYEKLILEQPSNSAKKSTNQAKSEGTHENNITIDKAKLTALLTRLRFTTNLYAFFLTISKNLIKEHNLEGPNAASLIQKTIKLVQSSAIQCDQSLEKCFKLLDPWLKTIECGVEPTMQDEGISPDEWSYPTVMGFDPLINFMTLHPGYARCPSIKSRPDMVHYFNELITKLRQCIQVSHNFYQKSFNRSLESIEQCSKYHRPKSCVLTRSFLLILYLPVRHDVMLRDELTLSLTEYCESIMPIIKKDANKSSTLNEFLSESLITFTQGIYLYGHNPSRQHEKIPILIDSFKNLQYSAFLVNDVLKNNFVYSWTTYYFAKLCIKYVLAGLELELFSPHEYPYVFWYLYDILYRNEKSELEYARQLLFESQLALDQEPQGGANNSNSHSNKSSASGKRKTKKKTLINTTFHDKNLLLNDALRFLTGGMFLLTYGLKLQGKIRIPSMEFTTEEICFDHRFGSITGAPVYPAYKFTLSRLDKLESIYTEASDCFSEAKQLFEKLGPGQEACLTVCKTNMVVARLLSSKPNSFAERAVEFCFDRHPSFPTVKL